MMPATKIEPISKFAIASQPTNAPKAPASFQSPAPRLRRKTNGKSTSSPNPAPSREVFNPSHPPTATFARTPTRNPGTVSQFGILRLRQSVHPAISAKAIAVPSTIGFKTDPIWRRRPSERPYCRGFSHTPVPKSTITAVFRMTAVSRQEQRPGASPGLDEIHSHLPVERTRSVMLSHDLLGIVGQGFGLRQKFQTLYHFRVRLGAHFHALILAESIHKNLSLDVGPEPLVVVHQIGLSVGNIGLVERLAEILHERIVHFEALRRMMSHDIALGEVEERIVL